LAGYIIFKSLKSRILIKNNFFGMAIIHLKKHRESSGICSKTVGCHPKISGCPATTVGYHPEISGCPATTVGYHPEISGCPTTVVGYHPETSGCPATTVGYHPEISGCPATVVEAHPKISGCFRIKEFIIPQKIECHLLLIYSHLFKIPQLGFVNIIIIV
jgi:hypothetical protein